MARGRYTEEKFIGVFQEAEAGTKVAELCRKYGVDDYPVEASRQEARDSCRDSSDAAGTPYQLAVRSIALEEG